MAKKLKNYEVLVKALNNFSLVNLDINVLRKGESVLKKIKETSGAFYDPYLSFVEENSEPFTLKTYNSKTWDGILEYSIDTQNWSEWDGAEISSSNDGKLYLRGTGNSKITGEDIADRFVLTNKKRIQCLGNIETLLDYETVKDGSHPIMTDNCYGNMFLNCTSLTHAPELPATTLAVNCYNSMFYKCTSLTQAPELPATTLADYCYSGMFTGCTSLTQAPELPATTLAKSCYYGMFQRCESLTHAPELPATTLAVNCYRAMFTGCESLTVAPELPATTLANYCYTNMFQNSSLNQAPELPATTLAEGCYQDMFCDCFSLTKAPELPATELAKDCYSYMFANVPLTQVPDFPATILADFCYNGMFQACNSLTGTIHCPASTASDSNRLDANAKIPANTATVVYDL